MKNAEELKAQLAELESEPETDTTAEDACEGKEEHYLSDPSDGKERKLYSSNLGLLFWLTKAEADSLVTWAWKSIPTGSRKNKRRAEPCE